MFPVRRRQVQERGWVWSLRKLPGLLRLAQCKRCNHILRLQSWLFWAEWRGMHGVRFRQVQERGWIYRLQQLPGGLELASAEYGFGRLHLQGWLVGA